MIIEFEFDHDIETVYKTITDTDFLVDRALSLGNESADAEAQDANGELTINLNRTRKIKVPAVLGALLKDKQTAISTEVWRADGDGYICDSKADIDGAPIKINGVMKLTPTDIGCRFHADVDVKARVLIGGGTIKKYASKTVAKELELECEYTAKHLS